MGTLRPLAWIAQLGPIAMGIVVGLAVFMPAVVVSSLLFNRSEGAIKEEIRGNLKRLAKAASTLVDPEKHQTFKDQKQEGTPEYQEAIAPLARFIDLDTSIKYVYTCVLVDGKVRFVLDPTVSGDRDNDGTDDKSHIMQPYENATPQMLEAFRTKASTAEIEPSSDPWGTFITGYAPIKDKDGKLVAIIGVDLTAERYSERLAGIHHALNVALLVAFMISCGVGVAGALFQRSRLHWLQEEQQSHDALEDLASSLDLVNAQLRYSNRRFEELFNQVPVACFTFDIDGTVFEWNRECERLIGIAAHDVVQKTMFESVVSPENHSQFRYLIERVLSGVPIQGEEWSDIGRDGQTFTVVLNCFPLIAPDGTVSGGIAACSDITVRKELQDQIERQVREIQRAYSELETSRHDLTNMNDALTEANERLKRLATIDPLTSLLNRRAIFEILEKCVSSSDRTGRPLSILMVDIDHFKSLNDMHGHIKGDVVLKSVASILKRECRVQDEVGRFGGEEFLVVLPESDAEDAVTVAERMRREVQAHEDEGLWVSVSIGAATYQAGFGSIEQFVDAADKALYESKRRGRNRVIHVRDITEGAA